MQRSAESAPSLEYTWDCVLVSAEFTESCSFSVNEYLDLSLNSEPNLLEYPYDYLGSGGTLPTYEKAYKAIFGKARKIPALYSGWKHMV